MVAHHEPVTLRRDLDQAQVERCLAQQIETGFAFALEQGLQARFVAVFGIKAPVQVIDGCAAGFVDHLQHVFADVPAERCAQGFMPGDHRLPGQGEALRVQLAVDAVAVLHVVQARARFQQRVQQHAFLHRRQRVDILDTIGRHRQCVELRLGQACQREVRRGQATVGVVQAVVDQAAQFAEVGFGEVGNRRRGVTLTAERPAQHQLAAVDLAVDAQLIGQRRLRVVGDTGGFLRRQEQGPFAEALVELAEVVERDRRVRQSRQACAAGSIGQVAQHAIAQAFVRHAAQLLLDCLDRVALPLLVRAGHGGQANRVGTGEPTHGAGQVDLVEQGFAAVAFQLHKRRILPGPAADYPCQRGQQQVVDLGAVRRGRLLQQLARVLCLQAHADGLGQAVVPAALFVRSRQQGRGPGQAFAPAIEFLAQGLATGIGLQACGPVAQRAGLGRQRQRLVAEQLAISCLQIVQQDSPGHAIDHQVMDRQHQALLSARPVHQHGAEQGPVLQVQAALRLAEQFAALGHRRHLCLTQEAAVRQRAVFGAPLAGFLGEAQAQGIVLLQQRQQRLLQYRCVETLQRFEHQCLVPMLALGNVALEEPVLDRREARFATEQALLGADLGRAGRHGGQALHGLVLEQITRAEMNAGLTCTADHLDRQDRIAAQLEEVVGQRNLAQVQDLGPDLGQALFQLVARGHVGLAIERRVRCRQGTPVELAVGGQRHGIEYDQVGRHHVVGQLAAQMAFQRLAQLRLLLLALPGRVPHQITGQLLAARHVQCQHHGFANTGVFEQAVFDLAQFDTEATNLHLMVDAPQVFHQAVGALAHQVAGAVQAPTDGRKRVGDEAFGGQAGTLVVALGQARATDVQLAGRTLGDQCQVGVEDVGYPRPDDTTDRHAAGTLFQLRRRQAGQWHHHGFGRAVGVEEDVWLERCADALQVLAGQRLAAGDTHAHRQGLLLGRQPLRQLAAVAWGETEDVDLLLADQFADFLGIPLALGAQHHAGTAEQRH
ncbi:hypothetical protein D3C84_306960 [compost metagenome]